MRELKNTYQLWNAIVFVSSLLTLATSYLLISFTWELGTNWGAFEDHVKVVLLIVREFFNFKLASYYEYKEYIVDNNYTLKWMLHILVPFFICLLVSLFITFKWLWVKGGIDKAIHINGSRLFKGKFAIKHARKAIKKELKKNTVTGISLHPLISISAAQEVGNILIEGAQGSGKSTVIKPIVNNIVNSSSRMLIYDAKREYTELFYKKGHLLLSPTDQRSLCWDISADVTSPEIALEIAGCFISQTGKDPIWSSGARLILTGCMVTLMNTEPNWSWAELKRLLDKPTQELSVFFEEYYPDAAKLISEDSKTTDSFIMEMTTKLSWLGYLAKVWNKESKYKFSVTEWLEGRYNLNSLIIPNNPKYSTISAPLCSAILSIIVREVLALPDCNKRKFWFVLDELADLPKTEALEKWLSLGRSKGARTIAGTQNISQIQSIYGDKQTETITSLFTNIITLKVGSSLETAKKVADNLGKRLVKRATINFDKEGNKTTSYQQSEEYIVRPEQLMQLPTPNKKGVTGYLSISGWNAVYELVWPYANFDIVAEAHIPVVFNDNVDDGEQTRKRRGNRGRSRSC